MSAVRFCAVLVVALTITACKRLDAPMPISEACGVFRETIYVDGSWKFSDAEIAALTRSNKVKIAALKAYWKRQCK